MVDCTGQQVLYCAPSALLSHGYSVAWHRSFWSDVCGVLYRSALFSQSTAALCAAGPGVLPDVRADREGPLECGGNQDQAQGCGRDANSQIQAPGKPIWHSSSLREHPVVEKFTMLPS